MNHEGGTSTEADMKVMVAWAGKRFRYLAGYGLVLCLAIITFVVLSSPAGFAFKILFLLAFLVGAAGVTAYELFNFCCPVCSGRWGLNPFTLHCPKCGVRLSR